MFTSYDIIYIIVILAIICIAGFLYYSVYTKEGFENNADFKFENEYISQVKLLSDKYSALANSKRPIGQLLETSGMKESEQCFVNFYSLGCRFTGYIGPMDNGYFDAAIGVKNAVDAGCRTFVLDIDYLDDCKGQNLKYFPRIVVRDAQGKMLIKYNSNRPICNSLEHSNIRDVCDKINFYAFSSSCQNRTDPIVIVLYFLRQPPGSYKSKAVLDYYSNVAKCLEPFKNKLITHELGGTFYRQKQEGRLLINHLTDYNEKVLIFSNANTSGFREVQTYSPHEDLDFMVNLRLSYTQTKLGITENDSGPSFGILETAEDYMNIPSDRADSVIQSTKLRWTICLSKDPFKPVSKDIYHKITSSYGVNCVPAVIFDKSENDFLFTAPLFKTYSFIPKPEPLRYIKPPIVTPAEPNPSINANQGKLREPTV